ncbi:MAG: phospholipid carrier-dependent glycosyltransferase [Acidobacteriota bacterium]
MVTDSSQVQQIVEAPGPEETPAAALAPSGGPSRAVRAVTLLLILVVALALRLAGIRWGMPLLCHPDEHRTVEAAAQMVARKTIEPDFYNWPNHVFIYLNEAIYPIASALRFHQPLARTYRPNVDYFTLVSRVGVAILGTLMVLVAYLLASHYGFAVGALTAALFALFPSYIEHSHYVTPDVPLTLFVLLVMLLAMKYLRTGASRYLFLAGMCAALATGVKYPGAITLALIAAAVLGRSWRDRRGIISGFVTTGIAYLVSLFVFTPYLMLRSEKVIAAVRHEAKSRHLGAEGLSWLGNMAYYADSYLGAAGILLLAFGLAGAVAIIRRERIFAIPALFGLFYWLTLSRHPLHWERWALPMYSSGLLLGAYGIVAAWRWAGQASRRRALATGVVLAASAISLASLTLSGLVKTLSATLEDTRAVGLRFLEERGITRQNSISDGATPLVPASGPSCAQDLAKLKPEIEFIIISEYMYGRYIKAGAGYEVQKAFYQKLGELPVVKELRPIKARHRLETLDVDEKTLQNSTTFELANIAEGLVFIVDYLTRPGEMWIGPTIKVLAAPPRPAA